MALAAVELDAEALGDQLGVALALAAGEPDSLPTPDGDGEALEEGDAIKLTEGLGEAEAELDAAALHVAVVETLGARLAEAVTVAVSVGAGEWLAVAAALALAETDALCVALGVAVGETDNQVDALGERAPLAELAAVEETVAERDCVSGALDEGVAVAEAVMLDDASTVGVTEAETEPDDEIVG